MSTDVADERSTSPPPRLAATLRVKLFAENVLVAESSDPALWQETLATISGLHLTAQPDRRSTGGVDASRQALPVPLSGGDGDSLSAHLAALAAELDVDAAQLVAACDPSLDPPYLHLDMRAWEDFKRNTGARGVESVAPIVLATTLLALWFKVTGIGVAAIPLGQKVLATIELRDKNPYRGLRNCEWLQYRADAVKLNPAQYGQAVAVARAYCSRRPISSGE